jgi:hypothetical protein
LLYPIYMLCGKTDDRSLSNQYAVKMPIKIFNLVMFIF